MSLSGYMAQALSPIGVPVRPRFYDGSANQYITYFLIVDLPSLDAENELDYTEATVQVDVYSKTDSTNLIEQVKQRMKSAGFGFVDHREFYENDTKLLHDSFTYRITRKALT